MAEPTKKKEQLPVATILKAWIEYTSGTFRIEQLYAAFPDYARDPVTKRYFSTILSRLVKEGYIERNKAKYGYFRRVETDIETMDWLNADDSPVDVWLPLELNTLVSVMPGNIIVIAGEKEVGKTTMALNIAWENRDLWDIHYFNSEMGKGELKKRILKFKDTNPEEWHEKILFHPRGENFADVIKLDSGTGKNPINIIDYMDVTGDDYKYVGTWIKAIHDKIVKTDVIVFICLQKPEGRDDAYGGRPTRDKPRIYLSMTHGKIKIVDAKNWADENYNPRNLVCDFKIVQGSQLILHSEWNKVDKWSAV